jgi:hypothetical protein
MEFTASKIELILLTDDGPLTPIAASDLGNGESAGHSASRDPKKLDPAVLVWRRDRFRCRPALGRARHRRPATARA